MRDTPRVAFLMVMNALAIALLVMLLNGCVVTPSRYLHGGFVSNMAATPDTGCTPGNHQRRG